MVAFELLPAAVRAVFALWALLLCLVNLGSLVLAAVKKHIKFTAFALLLFAPAYALWQVIFDKQLALFAILGISRLLVTGDGLVDCLVASVTGFVAFFLPSRLSVIVFAMVGLRDRQRGCRTMCWALCLWSRAARP